MWIYSSSVEQLLVCVSLLSLCGLLFNLGSFYSGLVFVLIRYALLCSIICGLLSGLSGLGLMLLGLSLILSYVLELS